MNGETKASWKIVSALCGALLASPCLLAGGGGDNDSPFNLPKKRVFGTVLSGGQDSAIQKSEAGSSSEQQELQSQPAPSHGNVVPVKLAASASFQVSVASQPSSFVFVDDASFQVAPPGREAARQNASKLTVGEAGSVDLTERALGTELRGRFELEPGTLRVGIRQASQSSGAGATLLIGSLGVGQQKLQSIDLALVLPLDTDGGVDLTHLAQQLSEYRELHGKGAMVLLTEPVSESGIAAVATAMWRVERSPEQMLISVDTKL